MLLACRSVPVAIAFGATSIPVATALIAAAFAARLGGGALARPAAHRAYWALGFACFAAGAAAEAYGASYGWSPVTFRIYYLAGGVLAVGLLGLGAICLHARRDVALLMTGAILATPVAASVAVLGAGVDTARLAEGGLQPPPNEALTGHAFLYAIALNTVGTLALLAGIVRSLRRRERPARQPPDRRRRADRGGQRRRSRASATAMASCSGAARRPGRHLRRLRAGRAARAAGGARRRALGRSAPDPRRAGRRLWASGA